MSAMTTVNDPNLLAPMDGSWGIGTKAVNLCEEDFNRNNRYFELCKDFAPYIETKSNQGHIKKMHDAIFYPRVNNIPSVATATVHATWDIDPRSGSYPKETKSRIDLNTRKEKGETWPMARNVGIPQTPCRRCSDTM